MQQTRVQNVTASPAEVFSLAMAAPDDLQALAQLLGNEFQLGDILAVFVKTEGNGLDNDFSRVLAVRAVRDLLGAQHPAMLVASGGCEGFTTPHMLVVVARSLPAASNGESTWMVVARLRSERLQPTEIGTTAHLHKCAAVVSSSIDSLGLSHDTVAYVHAVTPMVEQAHASKPASRAATALGVAVAVDGIEPKMAARALEDKNPSIHGSRCAVTAGDTQGSVDLLIFANVDRQTALRLDAGSANIASQQQVHCLALADALDTTPLKAHLVERKSPHRSMPKKLIALLYKADPPPNGRLRGERLSIAHDSDIHAFRHFRAGMSGVLAATTGQTRVFIGGGAEHHCPPGSGVLTVITESASHPTQSKGAA